MTVSARWLNDRSLLSSLLRAVHPHESQHRYTLMLRAYFDDSRYSDGLVVVAGWVANEEQWVAFEADWRAALREADVPEFHATDFYSARKHFDGWDLHSKRHRKFAKKFAAIACDHTMAGVGRGIEIAGYNRYIKSEQFMREGTPHDKYTPLMHCLRCCLEWIALLDRPDNEEIAVIMERGKGCGEAVEYLDGLRKDEVSWMESFVTLTTGPKTLLPLQAADLLAHETKRHVQELHQPTGREPRKSFERLIAKRHVNIGTAWSKDMAEGIPKIRRALEADDPEGLRMP